MPAATCKTDLIAITGKEFAKLAKLLAEVDDELACRPLDDGISIKDMIGHRAHWTGLFFGWYHQGLASGTADIPAKGYKWNRLNDYNAMLRQQQAGLDWHAVRGMLTASHAKLLEFLNHLSDTDLYAGPMKGGGNKWTTGRWAEASGASHYRSAAKFLRAALKEDR